MRSIFVFFGLILGILCVELLAGLLTAQGTGEWYQLLEKPSWTPPAWIFAPVWTVLYLMMAIAFFIVWKKRHLPSAKGWFSLATTLFLLQLFFNLIWSGLFFTLKSPLLGMIDIIVLSITLFFTVYVFAKFSKWAAILMVPYLLWVLYAASLNIALWKLNG